MKISHQEKKPEENNSANEALRLRVQVMELAQNLPRGRVISYGALGKRCEPPISGYVCGRVMAQVLDDVPWWRVVGKDGNLPISKRGPDHAQRQRLLLTEEEVAFDDEGRVLRAFFED